MHPSHCLFFSSLLCLLSSTFASPVVTERCDCENVTVGTTRELFLQKILDASTEYGNFSQFTPTSGPITVGIVGGGAAGLYSAILLQSLGIDYEILEMSNRTGGRIFTYRFNETAWDLSKPGEPDYYNYYDVGAMRFPGLSWMDRVIGSQNTSVVSYVNDNVEDDSDKITMIPYYFQANNTYRLYNGELVSINAIPSEQTFDIPNDNSTFSVLSPGAVFSNAVKSLTDALSQDFDTGFNLLMQYDDISAREYLLQQGYTPAEIDYIETITDATQHFDVYSLSQAVLEEWIFTASSLNSWQAVEGGMDRMINGMEKVLNQTVELNKRVTALKPSSTGGITVVINNNEKRNYSHVINTVPLGAMAVMDMTSLDLDYQQKLAIRKLWYDPAGKIGMSFKSRWWQPQVIGGQSFSDLPIRRCVYPSYGVNTTDAAGAMIASYTWSQDSSRLGAFYHTSEAQEHILDVVLSNLAAMNNVTKEFLEDQLVDTHFWDWYAHEEYVGAFAIFGPDQFSTLMPSLMQPAQNGRLHFAGEALSSGHAWIIGAVNSAYRSVSEILAVEKRNDLLESLIDTWGTIDEVDMGWYTHTTV